MHVLSMKGMAKDVGYSGVDSTPEEKARGITINTAHMSDESLNQESFSSSEVNDFHSSLSARDYGH